MIRSIVDEILRLQREYPALQAVGFGVPGTIDPDARVVVNLTNVNGWHHIPLDALVSEQTGLVGSTGQAQFAQRDLRDVRHTSQAEIAR